MQYKSPVKGGFRFGHFQSKTNIFKSFGKLAMPQFEALPFIAFLDSIGGKLGMLRKKLKSDKLRGQEQM